MEGNTTQIRPLLSSRKYLGGGGADKDDKEHPSAPIGHPVAKRAGLGQMSPSHNTGLVATQE